MSDERISSFIKPEALAEIDQAEARLRKLVDTLVDANDTAKKAEGFSMQAGSIKEVAAAQKMLVDAQGQLVRSTDDLTRSAKIYTQWKASSNGHTNEEIAGTSKVIKLRGEEAKAQSLTNKALLEAEKIRTQAARTQLELNKADAVRIQSMIAQEKELDRLIAKEEKAAVAIAKTAQATESAAIAAGRAHEVPAAGDVTARTSGTVVTEAETAALAEQLAVQRELAAVKAQGAAATAAQIVEDDIQIASVKIYRGYVKELTAERDNQNLLTAQGAARQRELNIEIDHYNKLIKQSVDGQAQQKINIGNYPTLSAELRDVKIQMEQLVVAGKQNSTEFAALSARAQQLTVSMAEVSAATKATAASTGSIATGASKAYGALRTIANILPGIGIAGIFGLAYEAVEKFVKELFKSRGALDAVKVSAETFNKALDSTEYKNAIVQVAELRTNIELAKAGFLDKDKVLHQYNDTLGKTIGLAKDLNDADQKTLEKGNAYVQMMLFRAAATISAEEAAKKLIEAEKERREDEKTLANLQASNKRDSVAGRDADGLGEFLERGRKNENDLNKRNAEKRVKDLQSISEDFQKQAAKIAKDNKFDFFGGKENDKAAPKKFDPSGQFNERAKALEASNNAEVRGVVEKQKEIARIQKRIMDDEKNDLDTRLIAQENYQKALKEIVYAEDGAQAQSRQANLDALRKKEEEYLAGKVKMTKYQYETLKIEIDTAEKEIANLDQESQTKITKITEDGAEDRDKIRKQELEEAIRDAEALVDGVGDKQAEARLRRVQDREYDAQKKRLNDNLGYVNSVAAVESAASEARIRNIDKEIEAIERKRDAEIDAINSSGASEEEKRARISAVEQQAAADAEAQNKKKRKEAYDDAKLHKDLTIARILLETALAVIHQYNSGPTATQSQRAFEAGAKGAAELAVAIATPLPAFAEGVESSPEGWAWTDERGPEFYLERSGRAFVGSSDGPTKRYLKAGTKIIPHEEMMAIAGQLGFYMPSMSAQAASNLDTKAMEAKLDAVADVIKNKREVHLNITEGGLRHLTNSGKSWQEHINKNVHW